MCFGMIDSDRMAECLLFSLKYVKSAKASTDVPASVRNLPSESYRVSRRFHTLTTGPRVHFSAPPVAERVPICLDTCNGLFLSDLDFGTKHLPDAYPPGDYHLIPPHHPH